MKKIAVSICCASLVLFAAFTDAADKETIAIIGTGDLGDSFGQRLAELGYPVVYGSRTPDSERVKAVVEKTGHGATARTQMEAAAQGHARVIVEFEDGRWVHAIVDADGLRIDEVGLGDGVDPPRGRHTTRTEDHGLVLDLDAVAGDHPRNDEVVHERRATKGLEDRQHEA